MSLSRFGQIGSSIEEQGKYTYSYVYKPTVPAHAVAGYFIDLNQTAGTPKYNAFAGAELTATVLSGSGNAGIYTGNYISGSTKHLARWQMTNITTSSGAPDYIYLNDYLMFYTLIDCDNVDLQEMENSISLNRYVDGSGVRILLIATAPMATTANVTINYINQDGVLKTSSSNVIPATQIGVCAAGSSPSLGGAGQATPFFPLASGDSGVRSIINIQFASGAGGFMCVCLVKPLAQMMIYESTIPVANEKVFGINNQYLPEIKQNAYLNFLIQRGSTGTANYRSELIFINT